MTTPDPTVRLPFRVPTLSATFVIAIAGYLGVNLSPYMITALLTVLDTDVLAASWVVTGALLATAVTGLSLGRLCAGPHRLLVTRAGLLVSALGFGIAALVTVPAVAVGGLLIGGAGAGGAVAGAGAALAAFRDPDRASAANGLANRALITVVLAVLPLLGLVPVNVFGSLALFAVAGLALSHWLPSAPTRAAEPVPAVTASATPAARPGRGTAAIGFLLLGTFAIWGLSEDALWAMAGVMGADQAGLTDAGLGIALSGATAGGLLGAILVAVVGDRLGRAVPLGALLVAGGAAKILEGLVTDATLFIVVFIVWNTIYAIAFFYFVAVAAALDATGRWSGPLLSVYLVGSSLSPVVGAALVDLLGYVGFATALGIVSFVLVVPTVVVARRSTAPSGAESTPTTITQEVSA